MLQTIHICTMTQDQEEYETALRTELVQAGYTVLASTDAKLSELLDAARQCDVCLVLLGKTFSSRDPLSSFSYTELEVAAAADANAGKILAFFEADADTSSSSEQLEFIERLRNFVTGLFQSTVSSPAELISQLPKALARVHPVPPADDAVPIDPPSGAMMISSTGMLRDERAAVRAVLEERGIPPIDYSREASEAVTPIDRVMNWARNCGALLLILGARYGYVSPIDGLGVTELEFVTALSTHRPILAFIALHPTDAAYVQAGEIEDQQQFIERVQVFVPPERVFHFTDPGDLKRQVRIGLDRLGNDTTPIPLPVITPRLGLRWYRRQVQRWLGTLPHLLRPEEGMPLRHIYVALQTLPHSLLQRQAKPESDQPDNEANVAHSEHSEQHETVASMEVAEALRRYPRLILQGDPGSGKSVVLRWYAISASPEVVPIYVRLSRYARALQEGRVHSLMDYLLLEEQRLYLAVTSASSFWRDAVVAGKGLILLDAMDEVADEQFDIVEGISRSLHTKVRDDILALASQVPAQTPIVVTTRAGADSASLNPAFTVTQIQPLGFAQQRRLIEQWLVAAKGTGSVPDRETIARAQQVLNLIRREPNVASLARRPLMLVLLTALSTLRGFDTETNTLTKAALLRRAIRFILGQWGTVSQRRSGGHLWAKEQVLVEVAWSLTVAGQSAIFGSEELQAAWSALTPADQSACPFPTLVEELTTRDGILLLIGEREYTFYHSLLLEYLGASWVASPPGLDGEHAELVRAEFVRRWRLFSRREETTQLLVTELDRVSREEITQLLVTEMDRQHQTPAADRVVRTLMESDAQPLAPHSWADPVHLALARAARCQGSRSHGRAEGGPGPELARAWGMLLRSGLSYRERKPYLPAYAGQALTALGPAAIHAMTEIRAALATSNEARRYLLESTVLTADPSFQDTLVSICQVGEGSREERLAALRALGRMPQLSNAARDLLHHIVMERLDDNQSTTAAEILIEVGPTRAEFEAIQRLGERWRLEAISAVPRMPPPEMVDILRSALYGNFGLTEKTTLVGAPVRLEAIRATGEIGEAAAPLIDQLLILVLRDTEANAQAAEDVVLSLGPVGVPGVRKLLQERYSGEGKFGPALRQLDEHGTLAHPDVQRAVHQALTEYREDWRQLDLRHNARPTEQQDKTEVESLFSGLQNAATDEEFGYYLRQFGDLGSDAAQGLDELKAVLRGERREGKRFARDVFVALERMGPVAAPALDEICALLDDEQNSADVRRDAIQTIASLGMGAAPALARLRRWLHDVDWVIRSYAAETIGHFGSGAQPAIVDLVALLHTSRRGSGDPDDMVRIAALDALAELWPTSANTLPQIQEALLGDPSKRVREAAARALGQIGEGALPAVEALKTLLDDQSQQRFEELSQAAAHALQTILSAVRDASTELPESVQPPENRRRWRFWGSGETR